jgi:hypothetical protein
VDHARTESSGEVFYESTSVEAIRERLLDGTIPRAARCRKNRVGEPLPIKDSLGKEEAAITVIYFLRFMKLAEKTYEKTQSLRPLLDLVAVQRSRAGQLDPGSSLHSIASTADPRRKACGGAGERGHAAARRSRACAQDSSSAAAGIGISAVR